VTILDHEGAHGELLEFVVLLCDKAGFRPVLLGPSDAADVLVMPMMIRLEIKTLPSSSSNIAIGESQWETWRSDSRPSLRKYMPQVYVVWQEGGTVNAATPQELAPRQYGGRRTSERGSYRLFSVRGWRSRSLFSLLKAYLQETDEVLAVYIPEWHSPVTPMQTSMFGPDVPANAAAPRRTGLARQGAVRWLAQGWAPTSTQLGVFVHTYMESDSRCGAYDRDFRYDSPYRGEGCCKQGQDAAGPQLFKRLKEAEVVWKAPNRRIYLRGRNASERDDFSEWDSKITWLRNALRSRSLRPPWREGEQEQQLELSSL
jgi:hypothetical protein